MEDKFVPIISLIKQSRANTIKAVNKALIDLYWNIGEYLYGKISSAEWGESIVTELARYIQQIEPELKGFSDKNLWRMKQFYEAYNGEPKLSPVVREIHPHALNSFKDSYIFDFFIDLLFYHRGLQCLVAFELKADKFRPEHLGQLNFYLEALDRDVKKKHENPSIGILLCKDKDVEVVEYALSRSLSPTMVSEYKTQLPDKQLLQQKLHELFDPKSKN